MKKTIFIVTLFAVLLSSCGKKNGKEQAVVNINVDPFTLTEDGIGVGSKSRIPAAHLDVVIFNSGGQRVATFHKDSMDVDFRTMSCTLTTGQYTMVAIGHSSTDTANISSLSCVSFANNYVSDIFCATQDFAVSSSQDQTLNVTLSRTISQFVITNTDPIPASVDSLNIRFSSGGHTLNPTTGLAVSQTGYSRGYHIPSTYTGRTNISFVGSILLNSNPQTMDVTVTAYDAQHTLLYSHSFNDVSFTINRRKIATGPLFSAGNTGIFTFNSEWLGSDPVVW